jgi:hypothetical protein
MSPPDLRSRDQWRTAVHPKTGEKVEDVIETIDGLFTICKTWRGAKETSTRIFLVWRRRPRPAAADFIGGYDDPDTARDAAARYLERIA